MNIAKWNLPADATWSTLFMVIIVSLVFIWATVRKRWLTMGGACAASALGCWVIFSAGICWLVPLFFFFGSSSVLGKMLHPRQEVNANLQGQPRDPLQVLCNGIVYGLCAALIPLGHEQAGHVGMIISMAVATADTWSSEIGTAVRGRTWDVLRFIRVPSGLSGGVSLAGTIGGAAGASLLFATTWIILRVPAQWPGFAIRMFICTIIGALGMLLDSILGAALQARYRTAENTLADEGVVLVSGSRWMTNNLVNLVSNAVTTGASVLLIGGG